MLAFEQFIPNIIKSLKATYGEEFFNTISLQLNEIIGADFTFIAKLNKQQHTAKTISLVSNNAIIDNFEYALQDTPCADVSDDNICMYPKDICRLYPNDQLLIDMDIDGYIGVPLHDSQGQVMGIVVALYKNEIKNSLLVSTLFDFFSGRISAEIERAEREKELYDLNETLEHRVSQRTQELSETLTRLKQYQDTLVEQEKMASLGNLVAGVAHEINTPLGVAILSSSYIDEVIQKLNKEMQANSLTKKSFNQSIGNIIEAQDSIRFNLTRAAELVQSFKQVAVDRNMDDLQEIQLKPWLERIRNSLLPMLKKQQIEFNLDCHQDIKINSFPAKLTQVITNLVSNSATHAFPTEQHIDNKRIDIKAKINKEELTITYSDNGAGISDEVSEQIFQPFFTTKRGQGSTGLGLSILSNIVSGNLAGDIKLNRDVPTGCEFIITLPLTPEEP